MATDTDLKPTTDLSAGAGIAIAGIWLASSAVSIIIMMIMFVWTGSPDGGTTTNVGDGILIVMLIIAAPLIAAYSITKRILGKDH